MGVGKNAHEVEGIILVGTGEELEEMNGVYLIKYIARLYEIPVASFIGRATALHRHLPSLYTLPFLLSQYRPSLRCMTILKSVH